MRSIGEWASERVGAAEMNLIWIVFAVLAVALSAGSYSYMRTRMRPAGEDEPEALLPSVPNDGPGGPAPESGRAAGPPGSATQRWSYKTDESGRPRRFLDHREAAWWAVLTTGKFFGPILLFALPGAIFGPGASGNPLTALPILGAFLVLWLLTAGTVHLYVALSGGVMGRAERQNRR